MAFTGVISFFILSVIIHQCRCDCSSTWSDELPHSVNSSGYFFVSINEPNIRLTSYKLIWRLINCLTHELTGVDFQEASEKNNISQGVMLESSSSSARFLYTGMVLESNLTIYNLNVEYNDTCLELYVDSCRGDYIMQRLTVKYCEDKSSLSKKLKVSSPSNASWNSSSYYSCTDTNAKLVIDGNFSNPTKSYVRKCQANAMWSGSDRVICAYAPNALIEDVNMSGENTLFAGDNITLLCNIDGGNPTATSVRYIVRPIETDSYDAIREINQTFVEMLTPDLNGASFTCQGQNEFTNIINQEAGISQPFKSNVQFAPMTSENISKIVFGELRKTAVLSYTFKANPPIDIENITLTFSVNGTMTEHLNQKQGNLSGCSTQTYEYSVSVKSAEQYGLYLLNVTSAIEIFDSLTLKRYLKGEVENVASTISSQITPGTSGPPNENNVPIYAIIVPVIGVIVGLIILIVYMVRKRQHKKDASIAEQRANPIYEESSANAKIDKEEKINPLYGSSSCTNAEKEERLNPLYGSAAQDKTTSDSATKKKNAAKSEKLEKKNPLYATSEGSNIIEDAYAEIEKSKNKGNANPVFTVETTGDTYAEVKKPKKDKPDASQAEVTYAEVQKSKRTKKDASLHGISND